MTARINQRFESVARNGPLKCRRRYHVQMVCATKTSAHSKLRTANSILQSPKILSTKSERRVMVLLKDRRSCALLIYEGEVAVGDQAKIGILTACPHHWNLCDSAARKAASIICMFETEARRNIPRRSSQSPAPNYALGLLFAMLLGHGR